MVTNPLRGLRGAGQAVWLDYLHRQMLETDEFSRLIEAEGVAGLTSNPSIFLKAIGESAAYDEALELSVDQADGEVVDLYERLAIADIRAAADQLNPLWRSLDGKDGFVSLEVSPYLAHDTEGTVSEARRLWRAVDRPNLMIKVPGTPAGVPAIRVLVGEGVNVNVTLLFSVQVYLAAAEAHLAGLEDFKSRGGDVRKVHGVASFFVSRIDALIDKRIDLRCAEATPADAAALTRIRGKVAIANAKVAYQHYLSLIATPRWRDLAAAGAAPQRLLWASTGTKDRAYSDVLYVEALIGPDTVDTMPPATLEAFRDHGVVAPSLNSDVGEAEAVLAEAGRLGVDVPAMLTRLAAEGVESFSRAFDDLLAAVALKREQMLGDRLNAQTIGAGELKPAFDAALSEAGGASWSRRLWRRDASLWTGADEAAWLGWLDAAAGGAVDVSSLHEFSLAVKAAGFSQALLLGMGGSSLGPEVLARTFGSAPGFPTLLVLDSTDPAQVARVAGEIDPARTLFVVASKSGSTLEPDVLHRYFFDLVERTLGPGKAGGRFVAITDPDSQLEAKAREQGFWRIFHGRADIGGRYSVLSNFGMVPAAILGLDVAAAFASVAVMARSCGASVPPLANPAFALGALMGEAAKAGRDKLTLIADEGLAAFSDWLEQLIAESTGKLGKGLIPIVEEPPRPSAAYGDDRLFIRLGLAGENRRDQSPDLAALEAAGHPVARISLPSRQGLFQEFLRWEIATAVAGAVIGINPFDQPDVEASKVKTRALTSAFESAGAFAADEALYSSGALRLFTDTANAEALAGNTGEPMDCLDDWLRRHLSRAGPGDYIALLAYLDQSPAHVACLQLWRERIGRRSPAATILQFGPRFLHSTGQAYKGGPASGVFLQITASPTVDLAIPGRRVSFGAVEAATARGDFEVLAERGRRVLRIDLGPDAERGLQDLGDALTRAFP
jgi:transaldolase/glucose-6-phosphate isomerase